MDAAEVGSRLRAERAASGRTIASVAADAGLSVPYIANLENGRGNPTLAALTKLAAALGQRLDVDLVPDEPTVPAQETAGTIVRFARTVRFSEAAKRLADATDVPDQAARQRVLALLAAAQQATAKPLSTTDCQRFLDALLLATLPPT